MHMSCYDLVLRLMKIKKKINFMHTLCRYNGIDLNIWGFFFVFHLLRFYLMIKKIKVCINQNNQTKIKFEKFFLTSYFFQI